MVTAIKIKQGSDASDILAINGNVNISSGEHIIMTGRDNVINIGTSGLDDLIVNISDRCPYVSKLSDVSCDSFGNINILGDVTSQVDVAASDNTLLLCDMSQRDDRPVLFRAIYDMLRILRRWIDAHKDSLLISAEPGEYQWRDMQDEDISSDYYLNAVNKPSFTLPITEDILYDSRSRSDIPSLGPALRLFNEYQSVVAMWNRIVREPESIVEVRIHPGDNAGIYIGVTSNIPLQDVQPDSTVVITTEVTAVFTGQTGDNLYVWSRAMDAYCRVYPARVIDDVNTDNITFPGYRATGSTSSALNSKLDRDGRIIKYPAALTARYSKVMDGTKEPLANTYTTQMIYEAIPFCMCYGETSYADSLFGLHYVKQNTNRWDIHVTVTYAVDNSSPHVVLSKSYTKDTVYADVCTDPYLDKVPDDEDDTDA